MMYIYAVIFCIIMQMEKGVFWAKIFFQRGNFFLLVRKIFHAHRSVF